MCRHDYFQHQIAEQRKQFMCFLCTKVFFKNTRMVNIYVGIIALCSFGFAAALNDNVPVIGILTQTFLPELHKVYPHYKGYIAASYIKAVEGSGGRVVPIFAGRNVEYYKKQLSLVNGVILPGGNQDLKAHHSYGDDARTIYKLANKINKNGSHFPILGVCLGLQFLVLEAMKNVNVENQCNCENVALPLTFMEEPKKTRLYGNADPQIISILSSLPVTSNHHVSCINPYKVKQHGFNKEWRVLSVNSDISGKLFVSSLESIKYPYAGLQFHPEKVLYEWKVSQNNPHTREAIIAARYFYDWLIAEARKNQHSFPSDKDLKKQLIQNYPVVYTGLQDLYFDEIFLFK